MELEAAQAHISRRNKEWDWAQQAEERFMADPQDANFCEALQGLRLKMWTDADFEAHRVVRAHTSENPHKVQDVPLEVAPLPQL
jgi:hypothetical protein